MFFCKCYCIAYLENKIIVYTLKRRKRNAYEVAPPKVARALGSRVAREVIPRIGKVAREKLDATKVTRAMLE